MEEKLAKEPVAAMSGCNRHKSRLFYIADRITGQNYQGDIEAEASAIPVHVESESDNPLSIHRLSTTEYCSLRGMLSHPQHWSETSILVGF